MGPLCWIQGSKMMLKIVAVLVLAAVLVAEAKTGKKLKRHPNTKARLYLRQAGPCNGTDFQCKNGQCIQDDWVCDTEADCTDGSDELGCPTDCSGSHQLKCKNGQCISREFQCDGDDDCGDLTDEVDCHKVQCPAGEVQCDNYICMDAVDGHKYCRKYCGLCMGMHTA